MTGLARAEEDVPFVAGRWSRRLWVGGCTVVGVLAAMVTIGDVLDQPDPPSDDLVAVWLLAEGAAAIVSALLLAVVLGRRSVAAGLGLAVLAPLSAAVPAAVVAVVLLVSLRSWRTGVLAVGGFLGSAAVTILAFDRDEAAGQLVVLTVVTVVLVLIGTVLGGRRALARQEHQQEQRERELVVEQARSQERARIAGEMHDSLSHHLNLIALHAGALGRRDDLPPETVRSSSRLVAELSRSAHDELREVLGMLHQEPVAVTGPSGAAGLLEVVEQHRAAGARIRGELDPAVVGDSAQPLSDRTSRLLHRVVRELLANAARHAPGAAVDVVVAGHGDRVEVRCRNRIVVPERDGAGLGMGLEGIAERVRLMGGEHSVEVVDDEFVVRVCVPW